MKIREIYDSDIRILTEKSHLPKWALAGLEYDFMKSGRINLNDRLYTDEDVEREVGKKAKQLEAQKIAGQIDHPSDAHTRLDKAAHILDSVSYDKKTKLASAKSYILDTSGGRNFLVLLKSSLKMGASVRGTGTVENKIVRGWNFDTVDFVLKPSFGSDAAITSSNLIESANDLLEKTGKKEDKKMKGESSEEFIQSMMESCYNRDFRESSFSGSFEDWKKKKETFYRATIAVSDGKYESVEEALEAMGEPELARKHSNKLQRVTPVQIAHEALAAGVSPQEFCDRINKGIDESESAEATNYSDEERQKIYENARRAGVNVSTAEGRKKALEKYDPNIVNDPDTLLEAEAEALYEKFKLNEGEGSSVTLESCRNLLLKEREAKRTEELKQMKIQSR